MVGNYSNNRDCFAQSKFTHLSEHWLPLILESVVDNIFEVSKAIKLKKSKFN
jgi:hypothetical protein